MILTDTEISECLTGGPKTVARMVEAAVLAKFCAGVEMPELVCIGEYDDGSEILGFGLEQIRTYGAAARVKALEDAAVVCEELLKASGHDYEYGGCEEAAQKIRALKGGA